MSDMFEQKVEGIKKHSEAVLMSLKEQITVAMDALKKANKEYEECPKEDASENAQLMTARENQARANHTLFMLQKRYEAFEQSLTNYTPIGIVTLGSIVELLLESIDGEQPDTTDVRYVLRMVQHDASDVASGFMSVTSCVGEAILGHVEQDQVTVLAPRGTLCYRIERIV